MPACKPWCPLVKAQLKKIATESPWILKKDVSLSGDRTAIVGKAPHSISDVVDKRFAKVVKDDDDGRDSEDLSVDSDSVHRRYRRDVDGRLVDTIDTTTDTGEEIPPKSQTAIASKAKTESATQWSVAGEGQDKLVETDAVEQVTRYTEDSASRLSEREKMEKMRETEEMERQKRTKEMEEMEEADKVKKVDKDTSKEDAADQREDLATFRDECDPSCPRRISRKSRIRKLEERQREVDSYLLNKGSGYFDDVCTCSLSCILRALRHDSFVRSILTSAALFTLGLKLCSELDAWYLPIRFS